MRHVARISSAVLSSTCIVNPTNSFPFLLKESFQTFRTSHGNIKKQVSNPSQKDSFSTKSVLEKETIEKVSGKNKTKIIMDQSVLSPENTKVGWIGTGVMGEAMCGHIQSKGFSVTVYNRTLKKTEGLKEKGAKVASSPEEVARESDVVFTIVGYPSDVREVILGEKGVLKGLKKGGIVVDMTTSEPSLARQIFEEAQKIGCHSVDAPVSGGDKGAKSASLAIMTGGAIEIVEKLAPLFGCMGTHTYLGVAGAGQSCKLANQVTIASTMVGLVEGMLYAHRAGLDVPTYLQAIRGGAAGSKSLELYSARILARDFQPGFYVNHFVKDLGIALEECHDMNLSLPGLALAQQLNVSLKAHGEGHLGTQALLLALERLNNLTLPENK